MAGITLDRDHTAVFIADFYAEMMTTLPHATERSVVEKAAAVQAATRKTGMMVCYCATVFHPGYPEISQRNKTFSQRKSSGQAAVPDPKDIIHPSVKPQDGEVVVGKRRVNALYGTGLDVALRANDIHSLMIFGYATGGVVLSTVRYGADLDYNLIVVEDCCSDSDVDVHELLTQHIFPRHAEVVGSDDVIRASGAA